MSGGLGLGYSSLQGLGPSQAYYNAQLQNASIYSGQSRAMDELRVAHAKELAAYRRRARRAEWGARIIAATGIVAVGALVVLMVTV